MSTGSTLRGSPSSSSSSSSSPPAPPAAPPSRLRRMASLTQCFRPSRQPPAEAAAARPPPPKRTFYVPTHAAASFARTAAPPPPRTIPEDDEATACPSSSRRPSGPRGADDGAGDYAAFLADAEARDRARRPAGWTQPGPGCDAGAARQRDSAYYSAGSRSSASAPRPPAQHRGLPSPCPAHAGRTLRRQPSATLGRRISQYIKPPREDDVAEVG